MLISKKIRLEVSTQDAATLEWMQGKCREFSLTHDERTPSLAENGMHLDGDETYRLFISLHEQLKHTPDVSRSKDEKGRSTHG